MKGWVCMSFKVWRQEKGGKGGREGETWMQIEGETDKREGERERGGMEEEGEKEREGERKSEG